MLRDGLSPHLRAPDGSTLLMYAALHGDAEGVRILLDAGADPNAANDDGVTALIWGAGDLEKTRRLVEAGADVNATSQEKMTPLLATACRVDSADCIRYLVTHGAAMNSAENGKNLLVAAARAGDVESVRFLLENLQSLDRGEEEIAALVGNSARWGQHGIIEAIFEQAKAGRFTVTDRGLGLGLKQALQVSDVELISFFLKKGDFAMTDRHSFLKGGWGRLPVVPGRGADSQLIRHVTDQIEDMEMPPLSKRKSYPKLTQADVQKLVTWIDEGVEWPSNLTLE